MPSSFRQFWKFRCLSACLSCYLSMIMSGVCLTWLEPLSGGYRGASGPVEMTDGQFSLAVSLVEVGGVLSPIPAGMLSDRIGRKWTIVLSGLLGLAGFLLTVVAGSTHLIAYHVARVFSGLALGTATTVAPVFLAEVSPPAIRGALAGQLITMFFIGQLIVYSAGHYLNYKSYLWVCTSCPIALIAMTLSSPESPSYLSRHGSVGVTLQQLEETAESQQSPKDSNGDSWKGWLNLLQPPSFKTLLVLQLLGIVSHANGGPTLALYATSTFDGREWLTFWMGCLLAVCSFLSAFLTDPLGRRPVLVVSLSGTAFATSLLAAHFYLAAPSLLYLGVVAFCVFYSLGISPMVMTLQGELFPASTRSAASAITELTISITSFLSLILYLPVSNAFGLGVNFIIYTVLSLIGVIVVIFSLPETSGINIDATR